MKWAVQIDDDGTLSFISHAGHVRRFEVATIDQITLSTVDLLTYDELLITLAMSDGSSWNIPEGIEKQCFDDILHSLESQLQGFSIKAMYQIVNQNPFQLHQYLFWSRRHNG